MGLAELKTDAAAHRERLSKMKLEGMSPEKFASVMRMELAENILPLFEGLLEAIDDEVTQQVDDLASAVDELIDQSEDVLHPETATKILGVFEVGKLLANELAPFVAKLEDAATKKRLTDLITVYRQSADAMAQQIAEITLEPSAGSPADAANGVEDDDDEDEDEDEDEGDEDGDEDDDEEEPDNG